MASQRVRKGQARWEAKLRWKVAGPQPRWACTCGSAKHGQRSPNSIQSNSNIRGILVAANKWRDKTKNKKKAVMCSLPYFQVTFGCLKLSFTSRQQLCYRFISAPRTLGYNLETHHHSVVVFWLCWSLVTEVGLGYSPRSHRLLEAASWVCYTKPSTLTMAKLQRMGDSVDSVVLNLCPRSVAGMVSP
jgi:hypothetical protein